MRSRKQKYGLGAGYTMSILSSVAQARSIPYSMNAVGTEWVTSGLPRMWVYAIVNNLGYYPIFLLTVPGRCLFCGSFGLFLSCFVMLSCTSVCWCLVVTCWERADLLALVCNILLWRCHFPIGILSIPDFCPLSYFYNFGFPCNCTTLGRTRNLMTTMT